MTNTRRAKVLVYYNGANISADIAPYLSTFSFTDNEGKSDNLQITLQDRDKKWQDPWIPQNGDTITAIIETRHWKAEGEVSQLDCGTFYVDDVGFKGPPDAVSIKAMSIPYQAGGKNDKDTKAWENVMFSTIAGEIAGKAGLSLLLDAPDFFYDRVDQVRETGLSFIKKLAQKEGLSTKVTNGQLVIYDEATYESKGTVRTIAKGDKSVVTYDFSETAAEEQYQKVEIAYYDDEKKKILKYVYDVPGVSNGPTHKINQRAKNLGEAMRWAKAEARRKNKGTKTAKLTTFGDTGLVQGLTVQLEKFGAFSGKYFIESCTHSVGNKYALDLNLREVLGF